MMSGPAIRQLKQRNTRLAEENRRLRKLIPFVRHGLYADKQGWVAFCPAPDEPCKCGVGAVLAAVKEMTDDKVR
jgi:hypothetical protein